MNELHFTPFVVQQGKATTQNQKTTKLMNHIAKNLGAISNVPSGGFAKMTIKVRLLDSFVKKEIKTKWVKSWLHQMEPSMETQHLKTDKEWIHFAQTLLKEHVWEWWLSQARDTRPTWNLHLGGI